MTMNFGACKGHSHRALHAVVGDELLELFAGILGFLDPSDAAGRRASHAARWP